ncbi:MAG TPA: type III-B CRISPR module-associated Cmr3 family protein [Gemmataceae bacterium]|nr:type III-B CRISPR module-associated Cmr3 family protein [Gemmataceae bacterium]
MSTFLRISGRDPLVARDGRPFGAGQGNRMHSSDWLYPSVVAGSFRTTLAKEANRRFDAATQDELLMIDVAGVLPVVGKQLYLPAPNDCAFEDKGNVFRARPGKIEEGEGADWPAERLRPVLLDADHDFKPEPGPAFWPVSCYVEWLTDKKIDPRSDDFLRAPLADLRDHVRLDPDSGAAEEGQLFTTAGISSSALPKHGPPPGPAKPTGKPRRECFAEIELATRVENVPDWGQQALSKLSIWHPLGGERRLAHWRTEEDETAWQCPVIVSDELGKTNRITMTLATPAIFRDGWKPGWLGDDLQGSPFADGPRLTLVGVCIQRWRAVSGWSYKDGGPKPIRRAVPAGGVYFFQSESNDNRALAGHWLRSVSDGEQERRDGFGLAVWGTW